MSRAKHHAPAPQPKFELRHLMTELSKQQELEATHGVSCHCSPTATAPVPLPRTHTSAVDRGSGGGLCLRLQLPQRTSPMLNLAQRGDRGLVRSWKRVQVLACGRDTGVAEALAHDSTSKMTVLRATLAMWFST